MRDTRPAYTQATDIGYVALACCLIPDGKEAYREPEQVLNALDRRVFRSCVRGSKNHPFSYYVDILFRFYKPGMSRREVHRFSGICRAYVNKIFKIKKLRNKDIKAAKLQAEAAKEEIKRPRQKDRRSKQNKSSN